MRNNIPTFSVVCLSLLWPRYGVQRLWGAFGFGVASFISGYLCDAAGGGYEGVMLFFVAVMAIGLMASTGVPVGRNDDLPDVDEDKDW